MQRLYRDFTQQAQIDAEYDAGASVPDYHRYLTEWEAASQAARAGLPCELGVPYGPTLAETLDWFPAAAAGAPVLVFLHGGYWRSLAARDFSFVAPAARQRGFATALVDYALCPWVTIDEIVRQTRAAIAWIAHNAQRLGVDPARIVVAGHSAGGHLAAASLLTPWARDYGLPQAVVRAAVPVSGLFDLRPLRYSYLQPMLQLDDGTIARNSPLLQLESPPPGKPVTTPVLVTWGADESSEFTRQSTTFAAALAATGTPVETLAAAGKNHFSIFDEWTDAGSRTWDWIARHA